VPEFELSGAKAFDLMEPSKRHLEADVSEVGSLPGIEDVHSNIVSTPQIRSTVDQVEDVITTERDKAVLSEDTSSEIEANVQIEEAAPPEGEPFQSEVLLTTQDLISFNDESAEKQPILLEILKDPPDEDPMDSAFPVSSINIENEDIYFPHTAAAEVSSTMPGENDLEQEELVSPGIIAEENSKPLEEEDPVQTEADFPFDLNDFDKILLSEVEDEADLPFPQPFLDDMVEITKEVSEEGSDIPAAGSPIEPKREENFIHVVPAEALIELDREAKPVLSEMEQEYIDVPPAFEPAEATLSFTDETLPIEKLKQERLIETEAGQVEKPALPVPEQKVLRQAEPSRPPSFIEENLREEEVESWGGSLPHTPPFEQPTEDIAYGRTELAPPSFIQIKEEQKLFKKELKLWWAEVQGREVFEIWLSKQPFTDKNQGHHFRDVKENRYTSNPATYDPGIYYFRVRALAEGKIGYWSKALEAKINIDSLNVQVQKGDLPASIRVSWKAVHGAVGYEVWESAYNQPQQRPQRVESTSCLFERRIPGHYHYQVRAFFEGGNGDWESPKDQKAIIVPEPLRSAPRFFKARFVSPNKIALSWTPVEGALLDGYRLEMDFG
jgi:hypothetical protein